jgi:hypothetical protein
MCRRRCDSNRSHVSTAAFVFCPRLNYHRTSSLSSVLVRFVFVRRISLDADSSPAPHLSSHTDAGASSFILSAHCDTCHSAVCLIGSSLPSVISALCLCCAMLLCYAVVRFPSYVAAQFSFLPSTRCSFSFPLPADPSFRPSIAMRRFASSAAAER